MHRLHCYDNIHVCKLIALYTANAYSTERKMSASACTRSMAYFVQRPVHVCDLLSDKFISCNAVCVMHSE